MFDSLLKAVENTAVAVAVRESTMLFPWIECVHVLALCLVVGSIAVVDLRLLGVSSLSRTVARLSEEALPITWGAFIVALISGLLLFSSQATKYAHNPIFQIKMLLLIAIYFNMLLFQKIIFRTVEQWNDAPRPPLKASLVGGLSLSMWIAVVALGRWIGFT